MRAGLDRQTGQVLTGWDHCVQSIRTILTTRIGSRVMRRHFGSRLPELQDANPEPRLLMVLYLAVAGALRTWEPGFRLRTIRMTRAGADGVYQLEMPGVWYPNGHLGDYSVSEERTASVGARASAAGITFVSV